jgi:hypothetical protein
MSFLFGVQSLPVISDISQATVTDPGTGSIARSMQAHMGDVVWAADYGVKADGATNDDAAWSAALAAATNTGARTVMAPFGTSIISTLTLPAGVTLRGVTRNPSTYVGSVTTSVGSILKKTSGSSPAIVTSTSTVGKESRGVVIRDLMLIGDGTHHGITLAAGGPNLIEDVVVMNCDAGIEGNTNSGASVVIRCSILTANTIGLWNVSNFRLTDSYISANGNGIQLDTGHQQGSIVGNRIDYNSGNGLQVDTCKDITATGNVFVSNGNSNIQWTNNSGGSIVGNVWINESSINIMSGNHLYLNGNADLAVIGNSSTWNGTGATPTYSIGGGPNTSVILLGNALRGHSGATAINGIVTGLTTTGGNLV